MTKWKHMKNDPESGIHTGAGGKEETQSDACDGRRPNVFSCQTTRK